MRRLLLVLLGAGISTTALADPVWTQPGWYQVVDTPDGPIMLQGPFADEASCKQALPPDKEWATNSCHYYETRPDFDTDDSNG